MRLLGWDGERCFEIKSVRSRWVGCGLSKGEIKGECQVWA